MRPRFEFDQAIAVVTGAASGIGAALAESLVARGCHLALCDVNEEGLNALAERISRPDRRLTVSRVDVSDKDQILRFREEVISAHRGCDLLINNAGVALGGTFDRVSEDDFDWLLSINLFGVIRMTRAFLPSLRASEAGHLVNISSIFGVIAPAGQTAYSASKFGVRGFSDALRHELKDTALGVTTVHPGGVNTKIAISARLPADATQDEVAAARRMSEKSLVMPPPRAAEIILRGVERRAPRVLVGKDAHIIALIERFLPAHYWSIISNRLRDEDQTLTRAGEQASAKATHKEAAE